MSFSHRLFGLILFFHISTWAAEPELPRIYLDSRMPIQTGSTIQVNAGDDLQAAINRAVPGDTIILQAGATFTGNFILPYKDNPNNRWIVIKSSNMTAVGPEGRRVGPSSAAYMPKVLSNNVSPVFKTGQGANYYRLAGLEVSIQAATRLNYQLIELGVGEETSINQLPHHIVIDRCYLHGQEIADVKRGIQLNAYYASVIDSYLSEFHVVGQDAQAIGVRSSPGPLKIVNNYLEAATENILFGGAGVNITNLVPSDVEFRRNHLFKKLSWATGIIDAPTNVTLSRQSGGSLASTTYYYRVVAYGPVGYRTTARSPSSAELSVTAGSGMNSVSVRWSAVQYANSYRVYRTADAPTATTRSWQYFSAGSGTSFVDSGLAGTADSQPSSIGTRWSLKNLFEIKNGQRMLVDGNVMENNWSAAQDGYAIVLTPRNSGADNPWVVVQDITFTNNIVRRTAGGIMILGKEYANAPVYSQITRRLKFKDNIFNDVGGRTWGTNNRMILLSAGLSGVQAPVDVTFDHNTLGFSNSNSLVVLGTNSDIIPNFTFKNNIAYCGTYGVKGATSGETVLDTNFLNVIFTANALIGCRQSQYDSYAGNFYPATVQDVNFVSFTDNLSTENNFYLASTSPYKLRATDNKDLGADIASVLSATQGVTEVGSTSPVRSESMPFSGTAIAIPGRIEVEDFDRGGEGVAYHDTTAGNVYGVSSYRNDSVDFRSCTDTSGCGYYVGRLDATEWMNYTVNVAQAGSYDLKIRVSTAYDGTTLRFQVGSTDISGEIRVPNTGGWQNWRTVSVPVNLQAGVQILKLAVGTGGFNINYFEIVRPNLVANTTPFLGAAVSIPGHVEAEDYDVGGQNIAYYDTTSGNVYGTSTYRNNSVDFQSCVDSSGCGYYVGRMAPTEWMNYTVNVSVSGNYNLQFRVSTAYSDATFRVMANGVGVTGLVTSPNTGGWQSWRTMSIPVTLEAGRQVIKVMVVNGGFNFNYFDVTPR